MELHFRSQQCVIWVNTWIYIFQIVVVAIQVVALHWLHQYPHWLTVRRHCSCVSCCDCEKAADWVLSCRLVDLCAGLAGTNEAKPPYAPLRRETTVATSRTCSCYCHHYLLSSSLVGRLTTLTQPDCMLAERLRELFSDNLSGVHSQHKEKLFLYLTVRKKSKKKKMLFFSQIKLRELYWQPGSKQEPPLHARFLLLGRFWG